MFFLVLYALFVLLEHISKKKKKKHHARHRAKTELGGSDRATLLVRAYASAFVLSLLALLVQKCLLYWYRSIGFTGTKVSSAAAMSSAGMCCISVAQGRIH
jgi:hypothetical protein